MAEFPALPVFTDALLADTEHLSDEEFGLYMRILILMWRTPRCRIPNDEKWLKKRLDRSDNAPLFNQSNGLMETLREFCQCDGNWWTQKRLVKEYEYLTNQRDSQGKKSNDYWDKVKRGEIAPHEPVRGKSLKKPKSEGNSEYPPHPTPQERKKELPLTPSKPTSAGTKPAPQGVFKNSEDGRGSFSIERHIRDDDFDQARIAAPKWDIYGLMRVYDEGINSGARTPPKYPARAFIAWIKLYTKGKNP